MTKISFTVRGSGFPVILLHGFPFNQHIWDEFAPGLATKAKVYTPDLPGFGESEIPGSEFSIDDIADVMSSWVEAQGIRKCVLIGHSLGGYVALAMARKKPDLFSGLVLFHSTAVADSDEKKQSRSKAITFVREHGAEKFTSNFIEPLFTDHNNKAIVRVREIAKQASAQVVIAYTQAMRDRISHESFLRNFPHPVLFLAGANDQGIPLKSVQQQADSSQSAELHTLTNSAHMGMLEEGAEALAIIGDFIARNSSTV